MHRGRNHWHGCLASPPHPLSCMMITVQRSMSWHQHWRRDVHGQPGKQPQPAALTSCVFTSSASLQFLVLCILWGPCAVCHSVLLNVNIVNETEKSLDWYLFDKWAPLFSVYLCEGKKKKAGSAEGIVGVVVFKQIHPLVFDSPLDRSGVPASLLIPAETRSLSLKWYPCAVHWYCYSVRHTYSTNTLSIIPSVRGSIYSTSHFNSEFHLGFVALYDVMTVDDLVCFSPTIDQISVMVCSRVFSEVFRKVLHHRRDDEAELDCIFISFLYTLTRWIFKFFDLFKAVENLRCRLSV